MPWLFLAGAIVWAFLLRTPLVLNARTHLDSDLAVDGLTLLEAVQGHWRWHYPGTPFSGILPVLLSWPQAMIWGATPETLVSGGVLAHLALLVAVFVLADRCYGRRAAIASLVPLTFASTGMIWLSGRITGGHLLVTAWSAAAWLLLCEVLRRGSLPAIMALGVWSGLGLYIDSMFLMTLGGMGVAGLVAWASSALARTRPTASGSGGGAVSFLVKVLALVLAFAAGVAPRHLGSRLEPYDAYRDQMAVSLEPDSVVAHARLLLGDCLPRLIAGHRLPNLEADPDPRLLGLDAPVRPGRTPGVRPSAVVLLTTTLSLLLFAGSLLVLAMAAVGSPDPVRRAVSSGLLASSVALTIGFVINRNIFNADNYRYLVLLLVPWAVGFGVLFDRCWQANRLSCSLATAAAIGMAILFTADAVAWYRQLGWIDDQLRPVRRPLEEPALAWLAEHGDVTSILGGYWDVYRLSFLTGGAVRGIPFAVFPNRFPEWSRGLTEGRPEILLARQTREGRHFLETALREGGEVLFRRGGLTIVRWPWPEGDRREGPGRRAQNEAR
ncbi:MAG: hypothetical protein U0790_16910 [Isosphaeraceae bacterium]